MRPIIALKFVKWMHQIIKQLPWKWYQKSLRGELKNAWIHNKESGLGELNTHMTLNAKEAGKSK